MREMTASEASRSFSAVLDSAERGETIVVTRAGRRVATIAPAPRANGAALRAVFERWHSNPALDDTLAVRVAAAPEAASEELDANPWAG
ncbi:type II toxin-antitoxin system Phd/YefM family antitoxin [Leekyejoonella antrihumi]|uniref:Antitoxin n=1 Tax=Leekyejoonella antrihumi TaxID=1660198 RepID=A0A563E5C3_9MICO|nr:type II toxin-antitoxin system prevent-host-death family antitoxin [Leekyejoonella antrihumi]TWP37625.1 type II toxin-antitoxin system prevent-host-death family antitoxin [Leekyejoonella antrihumi]